MPKPRSRPKGRELPSTAPQRHRRPISSSSSSRSRSPPRDRRLPPRDDRETTEREVSTSDHASKTSQLKSKRNKKDGKKTLNPHSKNQPHEVNTPSLGASRLPHRSKVSRKAESTPSSTGTSLYEDRESPSPAESGEASSSIESEEEPSQEKRQKQKKSKVIELTSQTPPLISSQSLYSISSFLKNKEPSRQAVPTKIRRRHKEGSSKENKPSERKDQQGPSRPGPQPQPNSGHNIPIPHDKFVRVVNALTAKDMNRNMGRGNSFQITSGAAPISVAINPAKFGRPDRPRYDPPQSNIPNLMDIEVPRPGSDWQIVTHQRRPPPEQREQWLDAPRAGRHPRDRSRFVLDKRGDKARPQDTVNRAEQSDTRGRPLARRQDKPIHPPNPLPPNPQPYPTTTAPQLPNFNQPDRLEILLKTRLKSQTTPTLNPEAMQVPPRELSLLPGLTMKSDSTPRIARLHSPDSRGTQLNKC